MQPQCRAASVRDPSEALTEPCGSLDEQRWLPVWEFPMFPGGDGVEGRLGANAGYGCEVMKGAMRHPS